MKKAILNIFMLALISVFAVSTVSCNKNSKPSGEGDAVTAFELSDDYIQLVVGESYTVDYYITPVSLQDKAVVTWESDDESIAEVDEDGCIIAVADGICEIIAYCGEFEAYVEVEVVSDDPYNGYPYVDLGLSVKWAQANLGADFPEDPGMYIAWGELSEKEEYSEATSETYGLELGDIAGDPDFDAVAYLRGGNWRMPTYDDFIELIEECTWEWVDNSTATGYKVTGPSGEYIFLPLTGLIDVNFNANNVALATSIGAFWTSAPISSGTSAYCGYFTTPDTSNELAVSSMSRSTGLPIRPVAE